MTSAMTNDQWMTRSSQNKIAGPFSLEEVIALVKESKLGPQDEVCSANGYWIYLHEAEEVKRQLGITIPRRQRKLDDEDTQTETETDTATQTLTQTMTQTLTEPMAHPAWSVQASSPYAASTASESGSTTDYTAMVERPLPLQSKAARNAETPVNEKSDPSTEGPSTEIEESHSKISEPTDTGRPAAIQTQVSQMEFHGALDAPLLSRQKLIAIAVGLVLVGAAAWAYLRLSN